MDNDSVIYTLVHEERGMVYWSFDENASETIELLNLTNEIEEVNESIDSFSVSTY